MVTVSDPKISIAVNPGKPVNKFALLDDNNIPSILVKLYPSNLMIPVNPDVNVKLPSIKTPS